MSRKQTDDRALTLAEALELNESIAEEMIEETLVLFEMAVSLHYRCRGRKLQPFIDALGNFVNEWLPELAAPEDER